MQPPCALPLHGLEAARGGGSEALPGPASSLPLSLSQAGHCCLQRTKRRLGTRLSGTEGQPNARQPWDLAQEVRAARWHRDWVGAGGHRAAVTSQPGGKPQPDPVPGVCCPGHRHDEERHQVDSNPCCQKFLYTFVKLLNRRASPSGGCTPGHCSLGGDTLSEHCWSSGTGPWVGRLENSAGTASLGAGAAAHGGLHPHSQLPPIKAAPLPHMKKPHSAAPMAQWQPGRVCSLAADSSSAMRAPQGLSKVF